MIRFIIKNEQQVNKNKLTEIVMADDQICRIFLQELLLKNVVYVSKRGDRKNVTTIKGSPLVDEMMREIFYFINTKISDKIYRLIELLCEVLPLEELQENQKYCFYGI